MADEVAYKGSLNDLPVYSIYRVLEEFERVRDNKPWAGKRMESTAYPLIEKFALLSKESMGFRVVFLPLSCSLSRSKTRSFAIWY